MSGKEIAGGIKAVAFDAGGTLFEPWPSVGHIYAKAAAAHGVPGLRPEILTERFVMAWRARASFGYARDEWAALVDATFEGLLEEPPSRTFFPALYEEFGGGRCWRVFEDVRPAIASLRKAGLRLAVISNWDERLRPLLADLGFESDFDTVVVSGEEGAHKPSPEIFVTAARRLGVAESAVLHIGDSPREDYEGARAAGCQALLLARGRRREEGTIGSLMEVAERLGIR
jgi:putative hydrolase of the HAD superfamily